MLPALERRATARELGAACTFVPTTGQVVRWLHAIDIFVLPSRSEALSNSLLEAMACGCCPVASRVGGNTELVRHGENGMLFDAGAVDQLSQTLETLLDLRVLRQQLSRRARETAEQFSMAASVRRMEEIYAEFIERSERKRSARRR